MVTYRRMHSAISLGAICAFSFIVAYAAISRPELDVTSFCFLCLVASLPDAGAGDNAKKV